MPAYTIIIDATSEDASNVQLDISDGTTFALLDAPDFPIPDLDPQWASSSDTEGALLAATRHQNRTITIPLRVNGGTQAGLTTALAKLQQKIGKILRDSAGGRPGGTLKVTDGNAKTIVFDLLDATAVIPRDQKTLSSARADTTLTFTAKPYGRGAPHAFTAHAETSLPCIVFTETGVEGDVPALGQLTVTETQGADQWLVMWGLQSRHYDNAATAKLFYEAETRTPLGGAATASVASASGGSVIRSATLPPVLQGVVSTQASGGGAHLTNVGTFHVYARVMDAAGNAGVTTLRLDWGQGDFSTPTANDPVGLSPWLRGSWQITDLGTVDLPIPPTGALSWEGRLLAASTGTADTVDVDWLMLVPADEGSGIASAVARVHYPTQLAARDDFTAHFGVASAALTGQTMPLPAATTWGGSGDATDFTVEPGAYAQRTAISGTTRYALGGATMTAMCVQVDLKSVTNDRQVTQGVLARYVDTNNWLCGELIGDGTAINSDGSRGSFARIVMSVAGTQTVIAQMNFLQAADTAYRMRLTVDAAGRVFLWLNDAVMPLSGAPLLVAYTPVLATGGTLASGQPGFHDTNTGSNAVSRQYDNYFAFAPPRDAALFASQTMLIRNDGVTRAPLGGGSQQRVSSREGDNLLVPPAGQEGRSARVIVKAVRNPLTDPSIDDITAQLTVTPRYLVVPE